MRRFQAVVHFPMPNVVERRRLWESAFSTKCPLEAAIDMSAVAAQHEMSGGAIMNVVRYASLMALQAGVCEIRREDLMAGIGRELTGNGRDP